MQQHQPVAIPKLPSRTRRSILTSLLLIAGAIFMLFFLSLLIGPLGQASPISFFGIFALALAYPVLLGCGLFSPLSNPSYAYHLFYALISVIAVSTLMLCAFVLTFIGFIELREKPYLP